MNLNQLFNSAPDIRIDTLSVDSRVKSDNALFFCLKGMVFDGHQFVDQAIQNGAVAIVHSDPLTKSSKNVAYILVDDVLKTLNVIASRFYGNPSVALKVFSVTGTNGKSTTAKLLQYFINDFMPCGYDEGVMGALALLLYCARLVDEQHTGTPEAADDAVVARAARIAGIADVPDHRARVEGLGDAACLDLDSEVPFVPLDGLHLRAVFDLDVLPRMGNELLKTE